MGTWPFKILCKVTIVTTSDPILDVVVPVFAIIEALGIVAYLPSTIFPAPNLVPITFCTLLPTPNVAPPTAAYLVPVQAVLRVKKCFKNSSKSLTSPASIALI